MRKVLSSIGIGSATVDTVLDSTTLSPGETVDLTVEMEGGSTEQEITGIYFRLKTRYRAEGGGTETSVLDETRVDQSFTLEPDEERSPTAAMTLPVHTPLTLLGDRVWLETGLDIPNAVDPSDEDAIAVEPTARMAAVIEAVEGLGFTLSTTEVKSTRYSLAQPFVQELEFEPTEGRFRRRMDELELIFLPEDDELTVRVEVDRAEDAVYVEKTGGDERATQVTIEDTNGRRIRENMRALIEDNL